MQDTITISSLAIFFITVILSIVAVVDATQTLRGTKRMGYQVKNAPSSTRPITPPPPSRPAYRTNVKKEG